MNAYAGRTVRVDLSRGRITKESIDLRLARAFIGGRGLGTKILYDEINPKVNPLASANKLIFAAGPLTGTAAPSGCRWMAITKGALTGAIASSNAGGDFGPELKYAGCDMIIVEGVAKQPAMLVIDDDSVELCSAQKIWGQNVHATEDLLHEQLGGGFKCVSIGPAGENLVRFASIMNDKNRAAGRSGVGAVMGSKKLKAIAVRGSGGVTVADPKRFRAVCLDALKKLQAGTVGLRRYGTASLLNVINARGVLPTRNFQSGQFEGAEAISGEAIAERILIRNRACFGCPIACGRVTAVKNGNYAGSGEGPEYESIWALGADVGVDNLAAATKANYICNELGMDPITAGATVACAMELYEKGAITEEQAGCKLSFGNADALVDLMTKIGYRRDFGDILAEGSARVARKFGKPELFMGAKRQEFPAYDARGAVGMGLQYATSNRGGCHVRGYMVARELLGGPQKMDPFTPEGKAAATIAVQDVTAALDSSGICLFTTFAMGAPELLAMLTAATGFDYDLDEMLRAGERIWNLERLFNQRAGFSRKDDTLPKRMLAEPMPAGPAKGMTVPLDKMLPEYYRLRGWDAEGKPTRRKLASLGL
jgi:aldehyde:ferredoxin oxidoreductase